MKRMMAFVAPLAALMVFGAGCFSRPVVQVPPAAIPSPAQPTSTAPPAGGTPTSGWNPIVQVTAAPLAYVHLGSGGATLVRDGQSVAAQDGAELESGDRVMVTTGPVTLVYPDAGVTRLDTGTDVTVLSDSTSTESLFAEIQVSAGRAWTRFERLLGNDEHFSVEANGVVATVRGTAFGVSVEADGTADIRVADHIVDVSREGAESSGIQVEAGQVARLSSRDFTQLDPQSLRARVRALTADERAAEGFRFAVQPLTRDQLLKPARIIRPFTAVPQLQPQLRDRLQMLRKAAAVRSGFVLPDRGLLRTEVNNLQVQTSSTFRATPTR